MKRTHLGYVLIVARAVPVASARDGAGKPEHSASSDGHPDLSGVWIGQRAPFVESTDPLTQNLASRDGTLLNFERDNAMIRRSDPNKPLYKPEFWEKVQKLDQNGNTRRPIVRLQAGRRAAHGTARADRSNAQADGFSLRQSRS